MTHYVKEERLKMTKAKVKIIFTDGTSVEATITSFGDIDKLYGERLIDKIDVLYMSI